MRVEVVEVSLRDGLQNEDVVLAPAASSDLVITIGDRLCQPELDLGIVPARPIGDCVAPRALAQTIYEGRTVAQRL